MIENCPFADRCFTSFPRSSGLLTRGLPAGSSPAGPLAPHRGPLDPLQIGKVPSETLPHWCQDLWLDCSTCSCSLRYHPRCSSASAGSFNRSLWHATGSAQIDEVRGMYNSQSPLANGNKLGAQGPVLSLQPVPLAVKLSS